MLLDLPSVFVTVALALANTCDRIEPTEDVSKPSEVLLNQSESLGQMQAEWRSYKMDWRNDHHCTYQRVDGGIGP
jgi:hypothetical protein